MAEPEEGKSRIEFSMPWVQELGRWFIRQVNVREYQAQQRPQFNERPIEYAYVFSILARSYPANILDIGTGKTALPQLMKNAGFVVTAIDNIVDYWPKGMLNRHYHVLNENIAAPQSLMQHAGAFDCITCISVLEHIEAADNAVANMIALLKPGGILILTFPYCETEYVANAYDLPDAGYGKDAPYICQIFSRENIEQWTTAASIVDQQYWQVFEGPFWTVGPRLLPPKRATAGSTHQLTCLTIQKAKASETS